MRKGASNAESRDAKEKGEKKEARLRRRARNVHRQEHTLLKGRERAGLDEKKKEMDRGERERKRRRSREEGRRQACEVEVSEGGAGSMACNGERSAALSVEMGEEARVAGDEEEGDGWK